MAHSSEPLSSPLATARVAGSSLPPLLRRVSIRTRIYAMCGLAVLLVGVGAAMSLLIDQRLEHKLHTAFDHTLPAVQEIDQAHVELLGQRLTLNRGVEMKRLVDPRYLPAKLMLTEANHQASIRRTRAHLRAVRHAARETVLAKDRHAHADRVAALAQRAEALQTGLERLWLLQSAVFQELRHGSSTVARRLNHALNQRQDHLAGQMQELAEMGHALLADTRAEAETLLVNSAVQSVLSAGLAGAFMLVLGVAIARSVVAPLAYVMDVARRMSAGQRSINGVIDRSPDEAAELLRTLYQLDDDVARAERELLEHAEQLESSNAELERRSRELAHKSILLEKARVEADAASQAKSQFLANMSHEIRTPMTAILGYADILKQEHLEPGARDEHLRTITRNGQHLLAIINDILDISKIEAGQMTVEQIETPALTVLQECVELLQVRARQGKVELQLEPVFPLPARVLSDPVRLRQILMNLVGNAIKFSPNGRVRVRVGFQAESEHLRVEVIDTGIGMPAEQVSHLFQPFNQADCSTTRRFGGTGLGLSISKRLAEMLGGDIEVVSTPGQGSTFTLIVPTGPIEASMLVESLEPARPAEPAKQAVSPRLTGRVLLAEDGVDNQRLLRFVLEKAGLSVDLAVDGQEALDRIAGSDAEGRPYDLVLMDMQMPRVDGLTATAQARRSGFDRPIVALTAHAMAEHREQAFRAGCSDYLTKPIDRAVLLNTLAKQLGSSAAVDPPPERATGQAAA